MENTEIMTAEPVNTLVTVADANGEIYQASNRSTLKPTAENVKIIANAVNTAKSLNASLDYDEEGNPVSFKCIGIIQEPGIRKAREKGACDMPCTNTTLVCEDGNAYFSQSEGIRKSADVLVKLGVFDAGEPVELTVEVTNLPNGNTIKSLRMI